MEPIIVGVDSDRVLLANSFLADSAVGRIQIDGSLQDSTVMAESRPRLSYLTIGAVLSTNQNGETHFLLFLT